MWSKWLLLYITLVIFHGSLSPIAMNNDSTAIKYKMYNVYPWLCIHSQHNEACPINTSKWLLHVKIDLFQPVNGWVSIRNKECLFSFDTLKHRNSQGKATFQHVILKMMVVVNLFSVIRISLSVVWSKICVEVLDFESSVSYNAAYLLQLQIVKWWIIVRKMLYRRKVTEALTWAVKQSQSSHLAMWIASMK